MNEHEFQSKLAELMTEISTLPATERDALLAGLTRLVNGRLAAPVECERPARRRAPRAAA